MNDQLFMSLRGLMLQRENDALTRLKENEDYQQALKNLSEHEKKLLPLFEDFSEEERVALRRYSDLENAQQTYELDAVYLQGLRDGARICAYLTGFDAL